MFLSYMVAPNTKDGRLKIVLEDFEIEPTPVPLSVLRNLAIDCR
jgi:hypothetical protein